MKTQTPTEIKKTNRSQVPASKAALKRYVQKHLNLRVPDTVLCEGHCSPMDYLWHCFNADFRPNLLNGDAVIWANRGGAKTLLGAAASLLDCIFKPGCEVRILAGSQDQAGRMYDYFTDMLYSGFEELIDGKVTSSRCKFLNGSSVEVLTQSNRSIRGRHIHKLRCDEVELFDQHVLNAARFITRSNETILSSMEMMSTLHKPYGLMQEMIDTARQNETPIFKWCLWEVIEQCRDRSCSRCMLNSYCQGRAKAADGYLKINDCITHLKRSSRISFESEMLCMRPSIDNLVFAEFDPAIHIRQLEYNPNLPIYRAIDFGFVNPFVCLWIQLDQEGNVLVIDEYVKNRCTIDTNAAAIIKRTPCREETVAATYCDPSGNSTSDITGTSSIREMQQLGISTQFCKSQILDGIELIRRALKNGQNKTNLVINSRCVRLIEAMQCYHYPAQQRSELPEKDGVYDHPIDALRYFFINKLNDRFSSPFYAPKRF